MQLRDYQQEACDAAFDSLKAGRGNPLIDLPTGCHAAGHPILMANGDLRSVETIAIGEKVMGPDGLPREVVRLCRGRGEMFVVTPTTGEPFVVNGDHILHLECTNEGRKAKYPSHRKGGEVDHISVYDYLKKSKSWKHLRKLRQCDAIDFPEQPVAGELFDCGQQIPPYIVGLMLGDGHMKHCISLTTEDSECADAFNEFAKSFGWCVVVQQKPENNAKQYTLKTYSGGKECPARKLFSRVGLLNKVGAEKHIPRQYGLASKQTRLELLAGLIDSDGSQGNGCFDFINKSERLAQGVAYVARSLGMRATMRVATKRSQVSDKRVYWRVTISGDISQIPCRLPRKKAAPRLQKKSCLRSGFKVEPIGRGNFYGFELDGDHLYVDGNFIVHHNSGKSVVLAELSRRAVQDYAGRVVILAHRKELLSQNAAKVRALGMTAGVYSAGLGQRNTESDVVVAGIQSIYSKAHWLGRRHMVIIDEAHLTPKSDDGIYRAFLRDLEKYNPRLRIVGLTATPFRLDSGRLWGDGELFSHVCYRGDIRWMIEQGYLCQLVNKPSDYEIDTSKLHTRYGEFVKSEVENLFSQSGNVAASVGELCKLAAGRKSVLVFCSGVQHAEMVAEAIAKLTGEEVGVVTGDTPPLERSTTLDRFGSGDLRWLCNVDVLTTGFDSPRVDCVAILRATQSAGLFCQIVGRGLRTHPSKQDCLVLDFGGNLKRHGPIDAVDFGKPKTASGKGEPPPGKTCFGCGEVVPASTRECECGFIFPPPERKHDAKADDESQLFSEPKQLKIRDWSFNRHTKKGDADAPNTLRVTYYPEGNLERPVDEWVCLNHQGFALRRALTWWSKHSAENIQEIAEALELDLVDAAIHMQERGHVRRPKEITVVQNGKWWRVIDRVDGELEQGVEEIPF